MMMQRRNLQRNAQPHSLQLCLRLAVFLFLSGIVLRVGEAQQQISLSQYDQFDGLYNPAVLPQSFILQGHHVSVAATLQTQWTKLSSAPRAQAVAADYYTDSDRTFKLIGGAYVINDEAGAISSTEMAVRLGAVMSKYQSHFGGLSAGIKMGMVNYRINTESLHQKYPDDILTVGNVSSVRPSIGVGVGYHKNITKGHWQGLLIQAGVSVNYIGTGTAVFESGNDQFSIYGRPHLLGFAQLRKSQKDGSAYGASVHSRYVEGAPINADFNISYEPLSSIKLIVGSSTAGIALIGTSLQIADMFPVLEGLLVVSYSFRLSIFDKAAFFGHSHELGVRFGF